MVAVPEQFDGSLEQAYLAYAPTLRRRARRWMPADEVDDAVQETFLRAWARHGNTDPGIPWLVTVLRNLAIDRSRRRKADPVGDLELLDSPHEDGPEQKVIALDERRAVRDAIRELTEGQRQALHLREWQGLSHQEIADSLGTTVPSVESLLVRSRKRMRGMLEKVMAVAIWPAASTWRRIRHLPADASAASPAAPAAVGGLTTTVANLATAAAVLVAGAGAGGAFGGGDGGDGAIGVGKAEAAIASAQGSGSGSGASPSAGTQETRYLGQQGTTLNSPNGGSTATSGGVALSGPTSSDGKDAPAVDDGSKSDPADPGKTPTHPADPIEAPETSTVGGDDGGKKSVPKDDPISVSPNIGTTNDETSFPASSA